MPNYPRMFAYATGTFTIGVIVYIFSGIFIPFLERPDWIGTTFMVAYGIIYASVTSGIAKRYIRKAMVSFGFPYILPPIIAGPAIVISELKEEFATLQTQITFGVVLILGAAIGAYLGIKAGHKKRAEFIEQAKSGQNHKQSII